MIVVYKIIDFICFGNLFDNDDYSILIVFCYVKNFLRFIYKRFVMYILEKKIVIMKFCVKLFEF